MNMVSLSYIVVVNDVNVLNVLNVLNVINVVNIVIDVVVSSKVLLSF